MTKYEFIHLLSCIGIGYGFAWWQAKKHIDDAIAEADKAISLLEKYINDKN